MTRTVLGLLAGVLSAALGCACSNSLPRPVPVLASQPAAPVVLPAVAPASSLSPANRLSDASGSQADVDIALRKRGYKPAILRGKRVYCRNEMLTGSNLATKVCQTAEQIEEQERAGRDILLRSSPAGCQNADHTMTSNCK